MDPLALKAAIRQQARGRRQAQPDKDAHSRVILDRFLALDEWNAALTVLVYLDVRDEVRTRPALDRMLNAAKVLLVPYVHDGELRLYHLQEPAELTAGSFGIPEPRMELRERANRHRTADVVDLVMAPGVAFDRRGTRLGNGHGYYDKLLEKVKPGTPIVGLAYECQLFDEIPRQPHDIPMHKVVTEAAIYLTPGSSSRSVDQGAGEKIDIPSRGG